MSAGWIPAPVWAWEDVCARMPRPWPDAAIVLDLLYWQDSERMGRGRRPSRAALCARWGLADHEVRVRIRALSPPAEGDPDGRQAWAAASADRRDSGPSAAGLDFSGADEPDIEADDATHASLCTAGYRFLQGKRGGCVVAVVEPVTSAARCIPDAIGWRRDGTCVLVEAKRSRSDYRADDSKGTHRAGRIPGHFRWYITPQGLIRPAELRDGWGLVEVRGSRLCVVVDAPMVNPTPEAMAEAGAIHTAVTRRLASGGTIDPVTGRLSTWIGGAP